MEDERFGHGRGMGAGAPNDEGGEEEDWEEEGEDDEEWEEGDEEEYEEEEEEGGEEEPPAAKEPPAEAKGGEAKTPKQAPPAAAAEKKAEKPAEKKEPAKKDEAPKKPSNPLNLGRTLFFVGLVIFFLSTCSEKSYIPAGMKLDSLADYYGGATSRPVKPTEPYQKQSALLKAEDREKEQKDFDKAYEEAKKAWDDSPERQEYFKEAAEHAEWVAKNREYVEYAKRSEARLKYSMGNWARTHFYLGQLGVLLMLVGLALLFLKADLWERIAALAVIGYAIIPLLKDFGGIVGMMGRLMGGG